MPAIDQRRTRRDALDGLGDVRIQLLVGDHAVDEALVLGLLRVEHACLQQDFESHRRPHQIDKGFHFRVGHDQSKPADGDAEAGARAGDPEVAHEREFQAAAHAQAPDPGDHGNAAIADGGHGLVHEAAVLACLRRIVARVGELADVGAGRERLVAPALQHDATQPVVAVE